MQTRAEDLLPGQIVVQIGGTFSHDCLPAKVSRVASRGRNVRLSLTALTGHDVHRHELIRATPIEIKEP